jgi:hypothetical protein
MSNNGSNVGASSVKRRTPPIESQDFPRVPSLSWPNTATININTATESQSLVLRLTTATAIPGFPILGFSLSGHRSGKLVSLQDVGLDQHLDLPPEITATRTSPSQDHRKLPRQDSRQGLSQPDTTLAAAGALGLSPTPRGEQIYWAFTSVTPFASILPVGAQDDAQAAPSKSPVPRLHPCDS